MQWDDLWQYKILRHASKRPWGVIHKQPARAFNILFIVRTVGKIRGRVSTLALIYKQLFIFNSWNSQQSNSDAGPWECSALIGQRRERS